MSAYALDADAGERLVFGEVTSMDTGQLEELVADLRDRVARLESSVPASSSSTDRELVERLLAAAPSDASAGEDVAEGTVVYAGAGPSQDGVVAWRTARTWVDVLKADPVALASVFSALASPLRVQIVASLAEGALSTRELTERLDQPTTGQLFHHIKDLLAAGVIHQPVRGTYAIRHQDVIPLLTALSIGIDLGHDATPESEGKS